jgi:hypothetical protein
MTTVQSLVDQISVDLLEPAPAQLATGLITQDEVVGIISEVMLDFLRQTGLILEIFTQQIVSGTSRYLYPDFFTDIYYVFVDGKIIEPVDLNSEYMAHPMHAGATRAWHQDGLPLNTIELIPAPNFNGTAITPNFAGPPAGSTGTFLPGTRNLTIVGSRLASQEYWNIGDTLDTIPDSLTPYIVYGVLARIFAIDGETRDDIRAPFVEGRYAEGVALATSLLRETLSLGDQERFV